MSCGPIPSGSRLAEYCGAEKHYRGQPLPVAFKLNGHVSTNWVEYFGGELEVSLNLIRDTCGLQLGVNGAFPVIPIESVELAIEMAGAIPDVQHREEGDNVSHTAIGWTPRKPEVDRKVVLQLSQQQWEPRPRAQVGYTTPDEWVESGADDVEDVAAES